jgi:hypothetical protein
LIVIFVVGAWLRFQHIGDIEVNVDQVYPIWQAIQTIDAGDLPLAGQGTSVLFANPPLTGYFFIPVIALTRQPIAAYAVTLTLNTFAIWLAYRGLRWLIGTRPALIGAALFAVNPWIIEDSRRTWVQSLAPFFVCLIFWALVPVLTGQTRHAPRRVLVALVGLALFAHTYLLAYALVAPVGLLVLLFWRRIPRRPLIIGIGVFAALMALYGIGLARQWEDTSHRADQFASGQAQLSDEALNHAPRLVTGGGYADARGTRAPAGDADMRHDLSDVLHIAWLIVMGIGIGRAGWVLIRRRGGFANLPLQKNAAVILLIWFLLPVLMMSYVSRVVHPFYLLLTVPAGHGLAAWGVGWIGNTVGAGRGPAQGGFGNPPLRAAGCASLSVLLILTAAINGLNVVRFAQTTAAYPGEDLPETLPLREAMALGSRLHDAGAPDLAVFSRMPEWTPIALVGENFRTEDTYTYGRAALIPPEGGLYVLFEKPGDPDLILPPYATQFGSALVLADGTWITIWRVTPGDLRIDHPADIPSDIDARLIGWTLDGDLTPGAAATLDTFWRIDALRPERGIWSYLPVAHVMDANGQRIAEDQGHAVSGLTWAIGDIMVQRLNLTVPDDAAGPLTLDLGLFDPVRVREDGAQGVNAIFRVLEDEEIVYTATIIIP